MSIPLITQFEKGPRGSGVIIDNGDTYLVKSDTGQTYLIAKTAIGNYVSKVVTNTKVCWSLNSDLTALWSVGPWSGVYIAEYAGMVKGENAVEPSPTLKEGGTRQSRRGGTYIAKDRHVFTVRWRILSPPFDGVETVKQYNYVFYLDQGTVIIRGGEDAKRLWQLMESHGIDMENESIPVVENVLPWLDKRFTEMKRNVQLKFEEGWVNDVTPLPVGISAPAQSNAAAPAVNLPAGMTQEQLNALLAQLGFGAVKAPQTGSQRVAEVYTTSINPKPDGLIKEPITHDEDGGPQIPLPGFTMTFKEDDEK